MYSIKNIRTGKYISWCDDNWYGTVAEPYAIFTKDEAEAIAHKLRKHYVYEVVISNGDESYHFGAKKTVATVESEFGNISF